MSWSGPQYGYWFAGTWEFAMYGVGGQRLLTVKCTYTDYVNALGVNCVDAGTNMYFGGKLMQSRGVGVTTDRLGSVRANGNGEQFAYYPYGEERTSTPDGREKWGTYTRDGTGTDYADQRYYNVGTGRFSVPDPGGLKTAIPSDPKSWNRYAYTRGNPVNRVDPTGRMDCRSYGDYLRNLPIPDDDDDCEDDPGGPPGYLPYEPPLSPSPPALTCTGVTMQSLGASCQNVVDLSDGQTKNTFAAPVNFNYLVSGGTAPYTETNTQTVTNQVTVLWLDAPDSQSSRTYNEQLAMSRPMPGFNLAIQDNPGMPLSSLPSNAAYVQVDWTFTLSVTITDSNRNTVQCPTVKWRMEEAFSQNKNGIWSPALLIPPTIVP
jgi:RHS repeat-associated protein